MVEDLVELVAPRAQAKNIEIACYVDPSLPAQIVGDAARIRQVLLNLVGNAIKFTEQGGVSIIIEPAAPARVRFIVRDTGIGLKAEDQARIFLEFEQADDSTTRKFGGTGLGLAISKRIVDRMNGTIRVDSAPGAGAAFIVTLPLPSAGASHANPSVPDLTGQTALMIATTTIEAELIARRLQDWGATTHIANSADDAAIRHADMVLIDFAAAAALMASGNIGALQDRRWIVLIKPTERQELPKLKQAGFAGYLVKPVRASSLAARLQSDMSFGSVAGEASATVPAEAAEAGMGPSVLVAEDNDINALLAQALLTRMGYRPTIAGDGEKAVSAWRAAQQAGSPFDLILMDLQMPHLDGLEAARRIRAAEIDLGQRPTPIFALTANVLAEDRDAALAAGMDGWLVKPLDRERLQEALAHAGIADKAVAA